MKKRWLSNLFFFVIESEKIFGILMAINTLVLIAMLATANGTRPLFLYSKTEGPISEISTEYVSYHFKTAISFYSTVIYCDETHLKTERLIVGYVIADTNFLAGAKEIEAWYYTVKGNKILSQLKVDGKTVIEYNDSIGFFVYITGLITLILEIFMLKHYKRNILPKFK